MSHSFNLKNRNDAQSLVLEFAYAAINGVGYDIPFDYKNAKLKVVCPNDVSGLIFENNIKGDKSTLTIKIPSDPNQVVTFAAQTFTVTFTDENNGTKDGNLFTLEIKISITMDIYDLAFEDGSNFEVTAYDGGATVTEQTATVNVKYNGGANGIAPATKTIQTQNVVGIYLLENGAYTPYTSGDIYIDKNGAVYTLHVKNGIDRSRTYCVGLAYANVPKNEARHFLPITINTLACHIEFASGNVPLETVDGNLVADVVVDATHTTFNLAAAIVNDDNSGSIGSGKITYELYESNAYDKLATGDVFISAAGVITVTPNKTNNTVYYKATYTDSHSKIMYTKYAVFKYRVAPSQVEIDLTSDMFDATGKVITLYYDGTGNYTSVNLNGLIVASNSFSDVPAYAAKDVTTSVALKSANDSTYVQLGGLTVTPIGLHNNAVTDVVIVITATFMDESVTEEYTVRIVPIQAVTLSGNNRISLVDNTERVNISMRTNTF